MIEFRGRLYIATSRRVFVRNEETGEFDEIMIVREPDGIIGS